MKKKFLGFLFFIILIVCIIFLVKHNQYKKSLIYTIEQIGEENYFLLMQNNKYGVINKNGDVVVDSIYDIIEIPNPSKALFVCKKNYNVETKNYNIQVYDDEKNQLLYQYYTVEAIKLNSVQHNGSYEKSVLKYKSNNKYGLIDFEGNKITEPVYDSIEGFEYHEGLLLVKKSDKYGIININGATIIKEKYDEILSDAYYTEDFNYQKSGYIVGKKTEQGIRYGYINYEGKQLLKNNFNEIYRITEKIDDENIYLVAFENGRAGVYQNGKNIVDNSYEDILYNSLNDLLVVQKNSKQGVIKLDGTQIIPIEYDNIFFAGKFINAQKNESIDVFDEYGQKESNSDYISMQDVAGGKYQIVSTRDDEYKIINNEKTISDGYMYIQYLFKDYFCTSKGFKNGIIDSNGNTLVDFNYSVIQQVGTFNIIQLLDQSGNTILLNSNLEEILQMKDANIYYFEEYIKVQSTNDVKYFDFNGNELKNTQVYKSNKLFAYKENSKWGFTDADENIVVEPIYDKVTEFNKYGYAGIKIGDEWGVINDEGTIVKQPTYKLNDIIEPSFIKQYYKIDLGYGESYFINADKT